MAFDAGIPIHVWVDETRPSQPRCHLTAWELGQHGVPHSVIVDNAGGHLMQHGLVDVVIVGSDRTTARVTFAIRLARTLKRWRREITVSRFTRRFHIRRLIGESKMGSERFLLKNAAKMKFTYFEERPELDKLRRFESPLDSNAVNHGI